MGTVYHDWARSGYKKNSDDVNMLGIKKIKIQKSKFKIAGQNLKVKDAF